MPTIIFFLLLIFSCGKGEGGIPKEPEEPLPTPLSLSAVELNFSQSSETKSIQITTGTDQIGIEMSNSGNDWCEASLNGKTLRVTVKKNETFTKRQASLKVTAGDEKATVAISQEPLNLLSVAKKVPLGGNSYITKEGAYGKITDDGLTNWVDNTTVFSTFFRINTPGELKIYLEYTTESQNSVIDVSCQEQTFSVELPKPVAQSDTIVYVGAVNVSEEGYTRVDFKGKTKNGYRFANPSSLYLYGTATASINLVNDFSFYWGRRGPSVHMSYTMPTDKKTEYFYNELTVPEGYDKIGSYFMANGFGQGYFGIQVNSSVERRVLFSVWSPYVTDNPNDIPEEDKVKLVKKGEGVNTGEFGNEGSGGQSYLKYNWKAGNTYKFLTRVRPADNGFSEYTSYFFAPETGKWKLIAQFLRPKTSTWYTSAHSFLENFNPEMGYISRKVYYNNQWVFTNEGKWIELTIGKFTVDETGRSGARKDFKGGYDDQGFFLQNCGFFNDFTSPDISFDRKPVGVQPQINWDELE